MANGAATQFSGEQAREVKIKDGTQNGFVVAMMDNNEKSGNK